MALGSNPFLDSGFDKWDLFELNMNMGYTGWAPSGDDVVEFKVIDPPDDRYIPGYSIVEADGDKKQVGPRLKDLNIPFSLYGLPIPITFGVRRLYGNIMWAIPLRENVKKTKQGGSGGPTQKTTEYQYFATYAVSFGYPGNTSPGKRDVLRVWADGSLIYDRRGTGQTKIQGFNFNFYTGTETQGADPVMVTKLGEGNVPGYRGMMYMVINDLPVALWGNRPPSISIEVGDATSSTFSVTNIQPVANAEGSTVQDFGFADYTRMLYYTVGVSDTNTYDTVRTFNMVTGAQTAMSYINNDEGVGWDNNSGLTTPDDLVKGKGIQATVVGDYGVHYIPWLNKCVAMAQTGAGRAPIFFFDPITGSVSDWIGAKALGTTHAYPHIDFYALGVDNLGGYISYPRFYGAQLVYGLYDIESYVFCQSFYTGSGIAILKLSNNDIDDYLMIESGVNYDQFCPGTVAYGYSDMMAVEDGTIYRYRIKLGASRNHSTNIVTGVEKTVWKSFSSTVNNVYYYQFEDAYIVFLTNGQCYKFEADGGDAIFTVDASGKLPPANDRVNYMHDLTNGYLSWQTNLDGNTYELDLTFGTITTFTDTFGNYYVDTSTRIFSSRFRAFIGVGQSGAGGFGTGQSDSRNGAVSIFYYDRLGDARMPLADFITGMALYAGYLISEIYVDPEIDDMIDGAVISQITSYRAVINAISAIYRIDVVESEGMVKFLRKPVGYDSTDFTVAAGETLLPSRDEPTAVSFSFRREEEIAVPQRVLLRYLDKALSYNWSMQMATRSQNVVTNGSNEQITYEVPIAMTATEAKTLAERSLWTAWSSRTSYDFRLSPKFSKIEPGDVGSVTVGQITYTVKAAEVTYNNDYSISIRGTSFQSDEAVDFTADSGDGYNQDIPFDLGGDLYIIDAPLLKTQHDLLYAGQFPLYMHLSPVTLTTNWLGASAYLAVNGASFTEVSANTNEGCVSVAKNKPVTPPSLLSLDREGYFDVVPVKGDATLLASCTEADLLNGENIAAYGANGRWEYIQFMTVTENGDGSYRLSNLVRALNGTDYAVDSHKVGDTVILLAELFTDATKLTTANIEASVRYKAVGPTQIESQIPSDLVALQGYAALPWVPTNIQITRSIAAGTGDITITWDRRSRQVIPLQDNTDSVPLGTTESNDYLVTILRWPYYTWTFSGGRWNATQQVATGVEFVVTGATSLTLTAAQIRTAELYEHEKPDDLNNSGSTFSVVNGKYRIESLGGGGYSIYDIDDNEIIEDLGYGEFVAFKHLDVMVQQKTTLANTSGYGPGRITRVYIQDT